MTTPVAPPTRDARESILRLIRRARVPTAPRTRSGVSDPSPPPPDADVLVALLVERLRDYGSKVDVVVGEAVASAVAEAVRRSAASSIAVSDMFDRSLLRALPPHVAVRVDDPPLAFDELDRTDAVITLSALAIAETGTIVLDGGEGQGRRVLTLLPDTHIVVVFASQIVVDVPDAVAALDPRRPLTWISGPSATSEIELERVEGVHGPRNLVAIVVR